MSNTITRRTALAVPVTLPLLPVSAYAAPADPAVEAYRVWRAAFEAYLVAIRTRHDDDSMVDAADRADRAAAVKLAETVPTSLAGLVAQISFMPYCYGEIDGDEYDYTNPANYSFQNWLYDDREAALCRSMLAGAERMAGVAS